MSSSKSVIINEIIDQPNQSLIQEENQSVSLNISLNNQSQFFLDIEKKLSRLKEFIEEIQNTKNLKIKENMLEYFVIGSEKFDKIDSNFIIKETEKRIKKMKKSKKIKKNWSFNDMNIFIWLICKIAEKQSLNLNEIHLNNQFWELISSLIPGTTPKSCLFKWLNQHRHKITLYGWKQSQEKLLKSLQQKHKNKKDKWRIISKQLYLKNNDNTKIFRHPKQCREHYSSFLDPLIVKGPWSIRQDRSLIEYIVVHNGEKKWCRMTKILEGRTQNAIKNRYQLISRKFKNKKQNKGKAEIDILKQFLNADDSQFLFKLQKIQDAKSLQIQKDSMLNQLIATRECFENNVTPVLKLPEKQNLIENHVKMVTPIILRHCGNFRYYEEQNQQQYSNKNKIKSLNQNKINNKKDIKQQQTINLRSNILSLSFSNSKKLE